MKAYNFLKEILPFLKYKKKQAEMVIRFQQRRILGRKRNTPDNGRFAPLEKHEIEEREKICEMLSQQKKVFNKSKSPSVIEYNFKSMVQE